MAHASAIDASNGTKSMAERFISCSSKVTFNNGGGPGHACLVGDQCRRAVRDLGAGNRYPRRALSRAGERAPACGDTKTGPFWMRGFAFKLRRTPSLETFAVTR